MYQAILKPCLIFKKDDNLWVLIKDPVLQKQPTKQTNKHTNKQKQTNKKTKNKKQTNKDDQIGKRRKSQIYPPVQHMNQTFGPEILKVVCHILG